jgi:hypothetical protein
MISEVHLRSMVHSESTQYPLVMFRTVTEHFAQAFCILPYASTYSLFSTTLPQLHSVRALGCLS